MPQRFLRPGITNSKRWNAVSWKAQSLYTRLLTRVDDYGRHDGRVSVIWSNCFAVWNDMNPGDAVDLQQVAQMLQQLVDKKLVEIYESEDKTVLQMLQWQERVRQNVKKWWPDKPIVQECAATLPGVAATSTASTPPPSSPPTPTPSPSGVRVLDELRKRINGIYRRAESDRWSYAEETELCEVAKRAGVIAELDHIERFRNQMHKDDRKRFFPQTVHSLLSRWTEALDKARVQCPLKKPVQFPIKKALEEKAISVDDLKASLEWTKANTPDAKETIATLERRIKEMSK